MNCKLIKANLIIPDQLPTLPIVTLKANNSSTYPTVVGFSQHRNKFVQSFNFNLDVYEFHYLFSY